MREKWYYSRVRPIGFEPTTSCSGDIRSDSISPRPHQYNQYSKGQRKKINTSSKNDLRVITDRAPVNVWDIDYLKERPTT